MAGLEREEGTKRSSQRARPSLGSGPSPGSALPESSRPGCAFGKASEDCPKHSSLCRSVPPVSTQGLRDPDGGEEGGGRAHTHSLSVLRGMFLGTLRSASP